MGHCDDTPGTPDVVRLNDLIVSAAYAPHLRAGRLDSLDRLFAVPNDGALAKPGLDTWRERIRLTLTVEDTPRTFYLKRFQDPPRAAAKSCRRSGSGAKSVAGVEWNWLNRLMHGGIPCARPIAFGELHLGRQELRSAILTEAVGGDSLETWANRWDDNNRDTIQALLTPLARLIARLHERGYMHRDLYLSHVFFDPSAPPQRSLTLIDLQRMIHPGVRRRRWVVKDLAALDFSTPPALISRTDRLRWLTQYLGLTKLDDPARRLVYRVIGKSQQIARHQRRRARRHRRDVS